MVWDAVRRKQRVVVSVPHNFGAEYLCTELLRSTKSVGVSITRLGDERRMALVNREHWLTSRADRLLEDRRRQGKPLGKADAIKIVRNKTQVFVCTSSYAGGAFKDAGAFGLVVVDEAGTCTEPELTGAVSLKASCRVLVGDVKQLGPITTLPEAEDMLYNRSMLARMSELGYPSVTLE